MIFYCYKITNLKNGKIYIGRTARIRDRWNEHVSRAFNINSNKYNYPLSRAIRKYGTNNFQFQIIACSEINQAINSSEKCYIRLYRSNINIFGKDFGYNLTDGGEGVFGFVLSDATRAKMSASHKGLRPTKESLEKRSKSRTGILHTSETKINLKNMFSGEKSSRAKLTWEKVHIIRELFSQNIKTQKELAEQFGISRNNINCIINNKTWRI